MREMYSKSIKTKTEQCVNLFKVNNEDIWIMCELVRTLETLEQQLKCVHDKLKGKVHDKDIRKIILSTEMTVTLFY